VVAVTNEQAVSPRVLNLIFLVVVWYCFFTVLSMHFGNGFSKGTNSSKPPSKVQKAMFWSTQANLNMHTSN
jgi:hypothetical protein